MINRYVKIVFITLSILMSMSVFAQADFKNEAAMVKKANDLFHKEEYVKAFEYYQTLLSNHRDNAIYSYRFGVCLMYSDKRDKSKPIKYLKKASLNPEMDIKVFYFLGRAYHQNYRFTEAKESYQQYNNRAKSKVVSKYNINRRIEECNNGLALLSNIRLLYVINKVEVKKNSFYRTYDMKTSGGMVIMKPNVLETKYDKKHNTDRTAFYIPSKRIIYFSSYGVKGVNGKDIYRAQQLYNGDWSDPEALGPIINTSYDEAYPYISPDGKVLYFSSMGHNSMGGFDIFKAEFNLGSFNWMEPENLNFPINTPFDDILYVPDTLGKFARFSSTRNSVDGLIYVYKIGIDKQEEQQDFAQILIKGGDISEAIKLIKEVAELKTNINIEDYRQKMAEFADTSSISAITPNKEEGSNDNTDEYLSPEEIIDSTFAVYRKMQYQLLDLERQKEGIQKVYKRNVKNANEITTQQGANGANEAAKYQKAAEVANRISINIDQEITNSKKASSQIMTLVSDIQYYKKQGNNDTITALYQQVQEIGKANIVDVSVAKSIIDDQYSSIQKKRDIASKYYELSKSYEDEVNDLTKERDEYIAESKQTQDADEKADYKELISELNTAIANKNKEKEQSVIKWQLARNEADSLSEQITYANRVSKDYQQETESADFANQDNISKTDEERINAQIAQAKTNTQKEELALNDANEDNQEKDIPDEPSTNEDPVKTDNKEQANDATIAVVAPVVKSTNNDNSKVESKQDNEAVDTNHVLAGVDSEKTVPDIPPTAVVAADIANNNDSLKDENTQIVEEVTISYLDNPESVKLVQDIDKSIDNLKNEQQLLGHKAIAAKSIGNKKYKEYTQLSDKIEDNYSKINLDNISSSEDRIAELNKLKEDISKANSLKREAAAAYGFATTLGQREDQAEALLVQATQNKEKAIVLLNEEKSEEANVLAKEIAAYDNGLSDESFKKSSEAKVANYDTEVNQLIYQKDSLVSISEQLQQKKLNSSPETIAQIDKQIEVENQQIETLALQIDHKQAQKLVEKEMVVIQSKVINIIADNSKQESDVTLDVPEEMVNEENIVSVFSEKELNQHIEVVDESINRVMAEEEQAVVVKLDESNLLIIPEFVKPEQKQAAEEILKPRIDAIIAAKSENELIQKKIVVSLQSAIVYTKQSKQKNIEIEQAYNEIDTLIPLSEQSEIVAKIHKLEEEELEINRNQEAIVQYVNILKKQKDENKEHISNLSSEINNTKVLISEDKIDSAKAINNTNLMLATIQQDSVGYVKAHLKIYKDEFQKSSLAVMSIEEDNNRLEARKIKITQRIEALNEISVPNKEEIAELDSKNTELVSLVKISEANVSKIDSLQTIQMQNSIITGMVEKQEDYINNDADLSNVDSAMIIRTNNIPIVSVNTEIFNPKYLETHGVSELLAQQQQEKVEKQEEIESEKNTNTNEQSSDLVLSNNDAPYIKRYIINKELSTISGEIAIIIGKRSKSKNTDVEDSLTVIIDDLNIQKAELYDELNQVELAISHLDEKGYNSNFKAAETSVKEAITALKVNEKNLNVRTVTLQNEAESLKGRAKKAKLSDAEQNNEIAMELNLAIADIIAMRNKSEFHENSLLLATYSDEQLDSVGAKNYIVIANQNMVAANARREMISNGDYSEEEQKKLSKEADQYEQEAINNQKLILEGFNEAGIIAVNIIPIIDNDTANAQRSAEEIPYDDEPIIAVVDIDTNSTTNNDKVLTVDNSIDSTLISPIDTVSTQIEEVVAQEDIVTDNPIIDQEQKQVDVIKEQEPTKIVIDKAVVSSLGVKYVIPTNAPADEDQILENASVLPSGLVYKVQMAAFKRLVPLSTFEGINPITYEKSPNSLYYRYIAGVFPNYNYARTARNIIRTKGYSDAFIVVYFNGKRISEREARRLIANGEAYTSDNLVQFAIANNTQYYSLVSKTEQTIASNNSIDQTIQPINKQNTTIKAVSSQETNNIGIVYSNKQNVNNEATIPLNKDIIQKGLVYKVQVSALRQIVSLSNFKGISPIAVEQLPGSNYYNYVAGAFPNYVIAANERDAIRKKGYGDAYIVVYFNGQRISLEVANQLIKNGEAYTSKDLAQYAANNNMKYYVNKAYASEQPNKKVSNNEFYYSVQIGVFAGQRTADRLFNIQDLYYNLTNSGYYRYFSGKYDNKQAARIARDRIRQIGVKDAFVVAFHGGTQISSSTAKKLESDAQKNIIVLDRVKTQTPTKNTNGVEVKSTKTTAGIVFRVQLGAYKGTRSSTQLKVINSMSENGISSYTTSTGLTIYFTNSYPNYKVAKAARTRIVAAGHTDVFVVALQNGQKISVRKALDLLGQ